MLLVLVLKRISWRPFGLLISINFWLLVMKGFIGEDFFILKNWDTWVTLRIRVILNNHHHLVNNSASIEGSPDDSTLYIGTEDGDLLHVDWKSKKDIETGFTTSNNPTWMHSAHDSGVHTMLKSPFFDDIFVTIGTHFFYSFLFLSHGTFRPRLLSVFLLKSMDREIMCWSSLFLNFTLSRKI